MASGVDHATSSVPGDPLNILSQSYESATAKGAILKDISANNEKIQKVTSLYDQEVREIEAAKKAELKTFEKKQKSDLEKFEEEQKRAKETFRSNQAQKNSEKVKELDCTFKGKEQQAQQNALDELQKLQKIERELLNKLQASNTTAADDLKSSVLGGQVQENVTLNSKQGVSRSSAPRKSSPALSTTSTAVQPPLLFQKFVILGPRLLGVRADETSEPLGPWKDSPNLLLKDHITILWIQIPDFFQVYNFLEHSEWVKKFGSQNLRHLSLSYDHQTNEDTSKLQHWRNVCNKIRHNLRGLTAWRIVVDKKFWLGYQTWNRKDLTLETKSVMIFFIYEPFYNVARTWRKLDRITFEVSPPSGSPPVEMSPDEQRMFAHFGEIAMRCMNRNYEDYGKDYIEDEKFGRKKNNSPDPEKRGEMHKKMELERLDDKEKERKASEQK